jgi:hypothetical protein
LRRIRVLYISDENSGFDIGSVNGTSGITATNVQLRTNGTVTQSQALNISGNLALDVGSTGNPTIFNLTNTGNAIGSLSAYDVNTVNLVENSGFSIGDPLNLFGGEPSLRPMFI